MTAPAGKARYVPHLLLTAMIAIWGASYAVVKVALGVLPPYAIVALRFWLALLCLLPFLSGAVLRGDVLRDLRRTARPGAIAGLALVSGYMLQTLGMRETTASMGGILAGLIVLFAAVGSFVFFRTRFGWRALLGLALGLSGTVMLCWPDSSDPGINTQRGIWLQIGSSTSYAAHVLLITYFGRSLPIVAFCCWQLAIVAIASTIAVSLQGEWHHVANAEWSTGLIWAMIYLGVFATALGIGVQAKVQHRIPPAHTALLFALQPVFAALVGHLAMDDRLGTLQKLGGMIVVVAVVLTSFDRQPPLARARPA